jgi:hypothetical protein
MNGTEGETAVIMLGLCGLGGISSLTVLLLRRKLTGTTRAQQDGPPQNVPAAAETGSAAAGAQSPSGVVQAPRPQLRERGL